MLVSNNCHRFRPPLRTGTKVCAWFALLGVVVLGVCAALLISWPTLVERYELLQTTINAWAAAHLPAIAAPIVRSLAAFALSPLLYIGLAVVLMAEWFAPADPQQELFSRGLAQDGFAWFFVDAPLKAIGFTVSLAAVYTLLDNFTPWLRIDSTLTEGLPGWALVLAAVVVGDLMRWVYHRLSHKISFLWYFHSIHHSQRELNLFTQMRFHAMETVFLVPLLYIPLYVLNLDFQLATWIVLFNDWNDRICHANLRTNYGPLRYIFVTPQSHRIHHSLERQHLDKNFATLLSVWDRLFGTQWSKYDEYPATGIADANFPWEESVGGSRVLINYVAQLIYPFRQIFGLQHPSDNRDDH
jgi:sterol desaturase/sphingolipid hydroxylase (fatty acid hydroxylase superfamily)